MGLQQHESLRFGRNRSVGIRIHPCVCKQLIVGIDISR